MLRRETMGSASGVQDIRQMTNVTISYHARDGEQRLRENVSGWTINFRVWRGEIAESGHELIGLTCGAGANRHDTDRVCNKAKIHNNINISLYTTFLQHIRKVEQVKKKRS